MTTGTDRPRAAVHVDLDGARHVYRAHGWTYTGGDDPLFETGLRRALDIFRHAGVRATLFVIAEDMADSRKRSLVRAAVDEGHEIASHSTTHRKLTALDETTRTKEIVESRSRLMADLGVEVNGFRAPGFHIDRKSLDIVARAGYAYDSSVLANRTTDLADGLYRPVPHSALVEIPIASERRWSLPFHPSYSLVFGDRYFEMGLERRRPRAPFILLFHLTDFADSLPRTTAPSLRQRFFTLSYMDAADKRRRSAAMLDLVRSRFSTMTTTELLASETANPVNVGEPWRVPVRRASAS